MTKQTIPKAGLEYLFGTIQQNLRNSTVYISELFIRIQIQLREIDLDREDIYANMIMIFQNKNAWITGIQCNNSTSKSERRLGTALHRISSLHFLRRHSRKFDGVDEKVESTTIDENDLCIIRRVIVVAFLQERIFPTSLSCAAVKNFFLSIITNEELA